MKKIADDVARISSREIFVLVFRYMMWGFTLQRQYILEEQCFLQDMHMNNCVFMHGVPKGQNPAPYAGKKGSRFSVFRFIDCNGWWEIGRYPWKDVDKLFGCIYDVVNTQEFQSCRALYPMHHQCVANVTLVFLWQFSIFSWFFIFLFLTFFWWVEALSKQLEMLFPFFILFVFSFLQAFTEVIFKFRSSMAELHGPGSTERVVMHLSLMWGGSTNSLVTCTTFTSTFWTSLNGAAQSLVFLIFHKTLCQWKRFLGKQRQSKPCLGEDLQFLKKGLLKTLRELLLPLLLKILLLKKHRPKNLLLLFRKLWWKLCLLHLQKADQFGRILTELHGYNGREPGKVAGPVAVAKDPRRPSVPYPQPANVSGPVAKDPRRPSVPYPQGGSSVPEPESEAEEGGSSNPRFGRSVPEQADPRRPSVPLPAPVQNLSPSVPAPVQGLSPSVPLPLALVSKPCPPAGPFTSGPKPPSYPPPADPLTWGPNPPSYPPPDPLTWIPKPPSDHHCEEAAASSAPCEPPPRNRWNRRPNPSRVPVPFLFVEENKLAKASTLLPQDVQDVIELDQENAPPAVAMNDVPERFETTPGQAASDPPTPVPVSRVPSARAEDVAEYDAYQKHVQNIVKQWLAAKQSQHSNPKYEQNALTSFLLMVLISSFLETAQDAVKQTYEKLHGSYLGWWEHPDYKEIDQLGTRKFCQHMRQGQVWRFLKSVYVVNFEPDNPGDIKGWKNWLSREQLILAMEFCFGTFWKNKVVSKEDKKNVLHNHLKIYWNWLQYLWEVQPD